MDEQYKSLCVVFLLGVLVFFYRGETLYFVERLEVVQNELL